jgi:hypothetical protein
MPEQNFSEQLWKGLADAVADIREKAVEEPWFGRVVTERGEGAQWPEARETQPEPTGLNGEILEPEAEPMAARDNAGLLEHGHIVDGQAARESSPQWPQAREVQPEAHESIEHDCDHAHDLDLDR